MKRSTNFARPAHGPTNGTTDRWSPYLYSILPMRARSGLVRKWALNCEKNACAKCSVPLNSQGLKFSTGTLSDVR